MRKYQTKITKREEALAIVSSWHEKGKKIVFTNGCFDILHLGHIDYLEKAKIKGDKLVIGVNTDDSIRRIKGDSRPVSDQFSRISTLAALESVDMVILFDEDTPLTLIEAIEPDILVKGNDYLAENIVGADFVEKNGGKVLTIPLVDGYSTSKIIDKIRLKN